MVVVNRPLSPLCPVCTVPSFSYNRPVQLKHAYNYILMRVLTQVTVINSLPLHIHIQKRP
ncbi:unnamed protein product [Hymenolepis diminuta]|uniref:Uncharacterized protein n=1 Tax=Hymenolepis diminuta TaxID=6216 RepID=A0A564Y739_HYMDI|nr:unnamed protein product [Hymenolepis diminuta]